MVILDIYILVLDKVCGTKDVQTQEQSTPHSSPPH